jgi:hypothetical protein
MMWLGLCIASLYASQSARTVSADIVLTAQLQPGMEASVLHNTITEHRAAKREPIPNTELVMWRGGTLRTDLLTAIAADSERENERKIIWTYCESRKLLSPTSDVIGHRYPTVEDIALRGESILILHIAQSQNKLTILERGPGPDSQWRTSESFGLDLTRLAAKGQESVGLIGRIVQLDDKDYLHFSHSSLPGNVVFRVDKDTVSPETDETVIRAVIDAAARPQETPATTPDDP